MLYLFEQCMIFVGMFIFIQTYNIFIVFWVTDIGVNENLNDIIPFYTAFEKDTKVSGGCR